MELQEFITNTLLSIKNGVEKANTQIEDGKATFWMYHDQHREIKFDVAITVSEVDVKKGNGSLNVSVINIGGEKGLTNAQENVSRIKFTVGINEAIS